MIELTQENYYDRATDFEYMSFSQFKNFLANPARAMADLKEQFLWFDDHKIEDESEREESTPLLVGNFIHSFFESKEAHEKFIADHFSDIVSSKGPTKGEYKKDFKTAEKMIERLLVEDAFNAHIENTEREVIVTGKIGGHDWKGKIDALNVEDGYFIDFKTVNSLKDDGAEWNEKARKRLNFIRSRGYDMQMAIYKELLEQTYGKTFDPFIWAVSKDKEPLAKPYRFTDETLENALDIVIKNTEKVYDYVHSDETGEILPLVDDASPFYNYAHRVREEKDFLPV